MTADMRIVISILALVGFAGARADAAEVASAMATLRNQQPQALSSEQIGFLESWLEEHRSGWKRNFATPPRAALSVQITGADGAVRTIAFFDQTGWSQSVILDRRIASFSPGELASLREQLGGRP
jgi:hypothetical protein